MISNHMASDAEVAASADAIKYFRLLKADELVRHEDFVINETKRFEPLIGLSGFRADAFVLPIYRKLAQTIARDHKSR